MDFEQLRKEVEKFRFHWNYLLTGFFLFVLIALLLYSQETSIARYSYSLGMTIFVFLIYFLLLWLESFFKENSRPKNILSVGSMNAFFAVILFLTAFFLDYFNIMWAFTIIALAGSFFLSLCLQKGSLLLFNYLEHRLDANSFVRTPENYKKIQMFWRILIVVSLFLVCFLSFMLADSKDGLYLFFILVSFFTSFIMFRFTQLFDNSVIRKHLISTSNSSFTSVIFFLFTLVFDKLGVAYLPWLTLIVAVFFFSTTLQKISFIGWFIH